MNMEQSFSIAGTIVAIITVLGSCIWAVGNIKNTASVLKTSVDNLNELITMLGNRMTNVDTKLADLSDRITRLEERSLAAYKPTPGGGEHGR